MAEYLKLQLRSFISEPLSAKTETNAKNALKKKARRTDVCHAVAAVHAVLRAFHSAARRPRRVYRSVFTSRWAESAACVSVCTNTEAVIKHWPCGQPHTAPFFSLCAHVCVRACVREPPSHSQAPFVWVSVSGVVCSQAPIVSNRCSLLTQGPWHLVFPWPPKPPADGRLKPEPRTWLGGGRGGLLILPLCFAPLRPRPRSPPGILDLLWVRH